MDIAVATTADRQVAEAFAAHWSSVYGRMLTSTSDRDIAQDATQEAFTRLLREARAGRYPDRPAAWLMRTAMNVVISGGRRATVARRFAPRLAQTGFAIEPDAVALQHELSAELNAAMTCLTEAERRALVMAAHGVPGAQIAARIDKTDAATRTMLTRARRRLRAHLVSPQAA